MENNTHMTRCKVCVKDKNIVAHGITALNTHVKVSKRKECLPNLFCQSFFKNKEAEGSASAKQPEFSCKQSSIDSCTNIAVVINAEIMWALDVVISKYSFNLNSNKNELFFAVL